MSDPYKDYPAFAEQLLEQHRNIERVLILIRLQVDSLRSIRGEQDLRLIERAVSYMAAFPSQVHGPREALLSATLVRNAPNNAPLCERLVHQKCMFTSLQSALLGNIRHAMAGSDRAYKLIKQDGISYCLLYADHIHSEEEDFLPSARRRLKEEDWEYIALEANAAFSADDYPELRSHDSLYEFLMSDANLGPSFYVGSGSDQVQVPGHF